MNFPCMRCGERPSPEDASKGARYLFEGLWLCVSCYEPIIIEKYDPKTSNLNKNREGQDSELVFGLDGFSG